MPYNPGITSQAGRYMFEGIRQAGQNAWSVLSAINQHQTQVREQEKQINSDAKFVDQLRARMPDLFTGTDEEWGNLGARDKVAAGRAAIEAFGIKQGQAQMAEAARRKEVEGAVGGFARSLAKAGKPGVISTVIGAIQGRAPTTPSLSSQLMTALQENPSAMAHPGFASSVRALADVGALEQQAGAPTGFRPEDQGVPRPIPGMPNRAFVPTSQGGGQILEVPGATSGQWQEQLLPDGTSTGWAIGPDGNYRRLRDKLDLAAAERFDADGDGIISQEEFSNSLLAQQTGVHPGMRVHGATAPTAAPSPADSYRAWKGSRK